MRCNTFNITFAEVSINYYMNILNWNSVIAYTIILLDFFYSDHQPQNYYYLL